MYSVNLTEEQFNLISDLVSTKFNQVANAWLPVEETKEINALCYNTLLNLRTVKASAEFDETYANWDKEMWVHMNKAEYLKEVYLVTDEELAQQGIAA